MKISKKLMVVPFLVGALGVTGCSLTGGALDKESMDQVEDLIYDYMDKNHAYSSEYTKDSLTALLNEGIYELTSKQYVNFELTEKIKAIDGIGNKRYASEPFCEKYPTVESYKECHQPYLNIKVHYDDTTNTFKQYVNTASYNNSEGATLYNNEQHLIIEYDGEYTYTAKNYTRTYTGQKTYTVKSNSRETLFELEDSKYIRPLYYYQTIYAKLENDDISVSVNRVNDKTVEYFMYDYENKQTIKCTFVNGMLEKYELVGLNLSYGEGTTQGIVEVDIKYSSSNFDVPDASSYTLVTE